MTAMALPQRRSEILWALLGVALWISAPLALFALIVWAIVR